jgi:hypothetical protein
MKFPDFEACEPKTSSGRSVGRVPLFFGGSAREVFRKLRKDVFPEHWAPIMRILRNSSVQGIQVLQEYLT